SISGTPFLITYTGGSGNDVVLVRTSAGGAPPSTITSINAVTNGQVQLQGSGLAGLAYTIQANTNLGTTNWLAIGTAIANASGIFSFTDTNAASFSQRYYRILSP